MSIAKIESAAQAALDYDEPVDRVEFHFEFTRREFVGTLGAGLIIAVWASSAMGQGQGGGRRGGPRGRGSQPIPLGARLHIGTDGTITVLTGKVECGQGSRAELTQAAAEEMRLPLDRIQLVMADTALVPNDGITAGSNSTPGTVPAIRQAAVAARNLLLETAAKQWGVSRTDVEMRDGKVVHTAGQRELGYADLSNAPEVVEAMKQNVAADASLTAVKDWKVMGVSAARPNARDLVTGKHRYPADMTRPEMLHGKVLRPPSYGAKLQAVDLGPAREISGVQIVQDGEFVGVCAASTWQADQALAAIADKVDWESAPHVSSAELYQHLEERARGGVPANPFADDVATAAKALKQTYHVAYVQHAPMEPRAAVAEWADGKLTVWTSTQNPFGVRGELARAFRVNEDAVHVIVPDFGGGFGGKHSGEAAIEAARLAKGAGRPVSLRWTRAEEFTWAYFRPAAVIVAEAGLDDTGKISSWHFVNINSGPSAVETPYSVAKKKSQFVQSEPPLRHGSYRALASTANNFARECFMDELAEAAGTDPLEFRLNQLTNDRLRAVLEEATRRFDWQRRWKDKQPGVGVGLACGTEKGSYVAACVEVKVDSESIEVRKVCQAFECGAIVNPDNLLSQVQGAIIMGLGPALREEMQFEDGKMLNAAFSKYRVPRFDDVPELDIHLMNRPDLPSAGAGETPIIAVAPAIAGAVFHATGQRIRQMPIRLGAS